MTMSYRYPVSMPSLRGNELEYTTKAVTDGWISSQGPYVPVTR
jgi:perosamine synthetase